MKESGRKRRSEKNEKLKLKEGSEKGGVKFRVKVCEFKGVKRVRG